MRYNDEAETLGESRHMRQETVTASDCGRLRLVSDWRVVQPAARPQRAFIETCEITISANDLSLYCSYGA